MMRPVFMLSMKKIGQDEFNARRTMRVPREWREDYAGFLSSLLALMMRCIAEDCVRTNSVDEEAREMFGKICDHGKQCLEEAIADRLREEMEERER